MLTIHHDLTSDAKPLLTLIDRKAGVQMSGDFCETSEIAFRFQMFARNITKKHLKTAQNLLGERFWGCISERYRGGDRLTRANGAKSARKTAMPAPDAEGLSILAVKGLFRGFGQELSNIDTHGGLQDDRADSIAKLAAQLCDVAELFGKHIRTQERPNNQFALFNLAYPSRFSNFMKRIEVADHFECSDVKPALKIHRLASAISLMRDKLDNLAAHSDDAAPTARAASIADTLTDYFKREAFKMNKVRNYGFVLFFHIGLAQELGFDFDDDEVLQASPAIRDVFVNALAILNGPTEAPAAFLERMAETLERDQARRDTTVFLGGLTEVGKADYRLLWNPLFEESKNEHKKLSQGPSLERHFVCYRLTSSNETLEIQKSFMVLQSPGRLPTEPHLRRKHFAMKVYTRYESTMVRSVGAVIPLGNEIVGFASRREIQEDENDRTADWLDPSTFRGATVLIFGDKWFKSRRGLLLGMLSTTNQQKRNVSCPVLCIQSDKDHSNQVGLDVIMKQNLVTDMLKHTRLVAGKNADPSSLSTYFWDMLWSTYYEQLEKDEDMTFKDKFPPVMSRNLEPSSVRRRMDMFGYSMKDAT